MSHNSGRTLAAHGTKCYGHRHRREAPKILAQSYSHSSRSEDTVIRLLSVKPL
jgi:hypothetical protein